MFLKRIRREGGPAPLYFNLHRHRAMICLLLVTVCGLGDIGINLLPKVAQELHGGCSSVYLEITEVVSYLVSLGLPIWFLFHGLRQWWSDEETHRFLLVGFVASLLTGGIITARIFNVLQTFWNGRASKCRRQIALLIASLTLDSTTLAVLVLALIIVVKETRSQHAIFAKHL